MPTKDADRLEDARDTPERIQEVPAPPVIDGLCTLARIDYQDAFRVSTGAAGQRTGEEWARVILEEAPLATRSSLLLGWSSLGLRLNPATSGGRVLGWKIRAGSPDFVLLGADSALGLRAQLLCRREQGAVLFCTLLETRSAVGSALWSRMEPVHRRVLPRLLGLADIP